MADYVDACPDAAGSGSTNGCPVIATPTQGVVFPVSAACLLGNSQQVNIRDFPSTQDAIVGGLTAGKFAHGVFEVGSAQGASWYFTDEGGYIRSDVVRTNGHCRQLPHVQTRAALLHVSRGAVDGLRVFPLQDNLNTLNVSRGLAINPRGEQIVGSSAYLDVESIVNNILLQAAADAAADVSVDPQNVSDALQRLINEQEREIDRLRQAENSPTQSPILGDLRQTISMMETLQAETHGILFLLRYGTKEDCPLFTKWVEYPPEILDQLERIAPIEPSAPCSVEVLFSYESVPASGQFDVVLSSLMVAIQP